MNRNGTPAIILICMLTTLPVLMDRRSQCLAIELNAQNVAIPDLYSTFNDRWNATFNLGKSEYDAKTTAAVNKIYEMAGKILYGQLKQEQLAADARNGNYADKSPDEANSAHSHDTPPQAVASASANTAAEAAKKNPKLIDAQVVLSDAEQLDHRQARKIRKATSKLCPQPHQPKSNMEKRWSSRPKWENRRVRPSMSSLSMPMGGGEEEELPAVGRDTNHDWQWRMRKRRGRSSKGSIDGSAVSGAEMNRLAENLGDDEHSNRRELPRDKWHMKLQIDGSKKNLQNSRSWPKILEEQSNEFIAVDEQEANEAEEDGMQRGRRRTAVGDYRPHINTRSVDSFPEVFSGPSVDSSALQVMGSGVGLSTALKNANSLLTSAPSYMSAPPLATDDSAHRIEKQIPPFDVSQLQGLNAGGTPSSQPGNAVPPPHLPADANAANLTNVMEKVLGELENLKECKEADNRQPEGSLCDVVGSWNSETIGLQFRISLADPSPSSRAFLEGKQFEIEIVERVPPRRHDFMDCDWYVTGSTIKQFGGPFYITAQKAEKYIVATFAGLCKTCGGMPTIFGSWTFVYPAKDCQDISLAVENKRDVFRKDNMEVKRKHRLEKLSPKGEKKCQKC